MFGFGKRLGVSDRQARNDVVEGFVPEQLEPLAEIVAQKPDLVRDRRGHFGPDSFVG